MKSADKAGFIILLSVLIFGSLGLFVIISLTFLGADSIQFSEAKLYGSRARHLATTCAETALEKLRERSCQGSGVLTFQYGYCMYTITYSLGIYTVIGYGYAGNFQKKILVRTSQILPAIVVSEWQEST